MTCRTSITLTSYEEPPSLGSSTSLKPAEKPAKDGEVRQRRRHSSYHHESWSANTDNVQPLVDRFLEELERRLDFLENYGHLRLDNAVSTLYAVKESCSHVSDEVIGAGRRRAKVMVDTLSDRLNERYKVMLERKETMEQKVQEGVRLMENMLVDFETRAYALRDSRLAAATDLLDEGRRKVDSGIERAKGVVDDGLVRARRAKEALRLKVDHALGVARERGLIAYEDLPDPWRVNPHIIQGYRFSETKLECLRSMVRASNETVNIWSHLIGLLIIISIAVYFYPASVTFSLSSKTDVAIAGAFLIAAAKCLVCSTLWHTMSSISDQPLMERFACVDYTGISLLVATSIMTTEYCAFYCEPVPRWTYLSVTLALGIAGTILPWHPTFNRMDMAWARVAFYVSLSATGFLPVFQLSFTRGTEEALYFYAPVVKSILVYLGGACLYAGKVPERWFPGVFDYVGGSHNIWHLAVLGGILFHHLAMHECFEKAFARASIVECSSILLS